jgi:hypothetical protein
MRTSSRDTARRQTRERPANLRTLKDGPLRLLAAEASNPENRENAYILIIDEMNRANLAKVFGELYFLLEYRKETVRLQYQPEKTFFNCRPTCSSLAR